MSAPIDANAQEFQDPLENYEPPKFEDALQQALIEEPVAAIQAEPFASASPETSIQDVVRRMVQLNVGCLLIADEGRLVGVVSNRDILDKVALEFTEIKDRPVREVMTADPIYVYDTDSSAAALCVMAVSGYRHVPVVDMDRKIVGIVSPHRVTEFLQSYLERN